MHTPHRRAEEKKNAPPKIVTAYAQFTKEMFPIIKVRTCSRRMRSGRPPRPPQLMLGAHVRLLQAKDASLKLPEVTKQVSKMWKEMPQPEKDKRTAAARALSNKVKAEREKMAATAAKASSVAGAGGQSGGCTMCGRVASGAPAYGPARAPATQNVCLMHAARQGPELGRTDGAEPAITRPRLNPRMLPVSRAVLVRPRRLLRARASI